jgi:menaquinone-dependent protoporphyrinogen IX oxidase
MKSITPALSAFTACALSTLSIYRWYKLIKLAASVKVKAPGDNQSLKHRDEVQVAFVAEQAINQARCLTTQQCPKFCGNVSNLKL